MKKRKLKKSGVIIFVFLFLVIALLSAYLIFSSCLKLNVKNTSISVNSKYKESVRLLL